MFERIPRSVREEQLNALPGIRFVRWESSFRNAQSKAVVQCLRDGHIWSTSAHNLINGSRGCAKCSKRYCYTEREREEQLNNLPGLRFVEWEDGSYKTQHSRAVMRCSNGHVWSATTRSLFNNGSGCPQCATSGFDPGSSATLYAISTMCHGHIKIGISNKYKSRLRRLKNKTPFEFKLVSLIHSRNGQEVADLEKLFHSNFESSGFSGFDGATEWLKFDPSIIELMKMLGAEVPDDLLSPPQ